MHLQEFRTKLATFAGHYLTEASAYSAKLCEAGLTEAKLRAIAKAAARGVVDDGLRAAMVARLAPKIEADEADLWVEQLAFALENRAACLEGRRI